MSITFLDVKQAVASWGWHLSAPMRRRGCVVLMYHRIGRQNDLFPNTEVGLFRRQLQWLAANCDVIGPAELRDAARRPSSARPAVLLTFDDGYRDYHDIAYPVLKEFGMPAVVFPITDYMDHPRPLWFDRLHLAVLGARVERVALPWQPDRRAHLGGDRNDAFINECKAHLKSVSDDEKERLLDELVKALAPARIDVGRQLMTWDEVRATMDLTTYGGHTHTHPLMSRIDSVRLEREVRLCRDRLIAETGVRPTLFAYPNGNFTSEAKTVLARHGFETAFSTTEGLADATGDWLEVRRVGVGHILPTVWMIRHSWTWTPSPAVGARVPQELSGRGGLAG